MKSYFITYIYLVVIATLFLNACTPNANTYYNRQMQPIVTKYNVLFNGEEAFDAGLKELQEQYQDDFSQILPVEPIQMSGKIQLDGVENPLFERAEEKAIKTIQLHSMVYNGVQRNYKIDDAYILLGKARYYNERFLPALEAFNHLLTNYGKSERIPEANVWAQKTNLRIGNDRLAIEKLNKLLKEEKLRRKDKAEAYATLGQAYINQENFSDAAEALYLAGKYTPSKPLRGRYFFIAAQLYEKQREKDSAVVAYEKVIRLNWKIPRRLWVEAHAGRVRNKTFSPEEKNDFLEYLTRLENRYEHKNYLDVLFFQHAVLLEEQNKNGAIGFYKKSLKHNDQNTPLKAQTHERLADLSFEKKDYIQAYHHLDSTLAYIPENTLKRLYVQRKKDNLAKITELEYAVKQNDSILKLAKLSKSEQILFFKKHIDSLQKVTEQKKQTPIAEQQQGMGITLSNVEQQQGGRFYFYNPMAVAYGKQRFQQYWGNRELKDDWRWSTKEHVLPESDQKTENQQQESQNQLTPEFYIEQLPQSDTAIALLEKNRNEALYQLGVLYKAKFNDNELAIERLERVLEQQPQEDIEAATLYELHKIYTDLKHSKLELVTNQLVSKYPNSDYTSLLQGTQTSKQQKEQQAKQLIEEVNTLFANEKIAEALHLLNNKGVFVKETTLAPQFEMLKANALGRLSGIQSYRSALEMISINYPESNEANHAKELLEKLKDIENESFVEDSKATSWKIVVTTVSEKNKENIKSQLTEKLKLISNKMSISEDIYTVDESWIVIHGIQNRATAENVQNELLPIISKNELFAFPVATENYRLIQIRKEKNLYLEKSKL